MTEHIAPGTVFVPFNQPGLAANTLLSGAFVDHRRGRAGGDGRAVETEPLAAVGEDAP